MKLDLLNKKARVSPIGWTAKLFAQNNKVKLEIIKH